ncbi:hypothetical protein BOTCAL_0057g00360 [Botryotinia calthae]|uniref:Uncharacterized protein n=1 Tax=Botryotinia calthae TaxID=38488 RepID=A0A4Y8DAB4_9HELO|nr:hypothetical protein BOTCAL_0057g00360 [Botryotinia calthae]
MLGFKEHTPCVLRKPNHKHKEMQFHLIHQNTKEEIGHRSGLSELTRHPLGDIDGDNGDIPPGEREWMKPEKIVIWPRCRVMKLSVGSAGIYLI